MFLKTFEVRNRHYSNRILIHIWSALPSLTVWSEFASDWQLLRDGRLQLGSDWLFSSGLWNLADAIRSTGGHRGTCFFSDYLSHALLSGYSDRFIKITFFNHICSLRSDQKGQLNSLLLLMVMYLITHTHTLVQVKSIGWKLDVCQCHIT